MQNSIESNGGLERLNSAVSNFRTISERKRKLEEEKEQKDNWTSEEDDSLTKLSIDLHDAAEAIKNTLLEILPAELGNELLQEISDSGIDPDFKTSDLILSIVGQNGFDSNPLESVAAFLNRE